MYSSILLKPTKSCNADCAYCSSPPDGNDKWTLDDFHRYYLALEPHLNDKAMLIWHGGEPMLMGPHFIRECAEFVWSRKPGIRFAMQTNILAYGHGWRDVFREVLGGRISTSYDPDETLRTLGGSASLYAERFKQAISKVMADGVRPMVVSTYTNDTAGRAHELYDISLNKTWGDSFPIRVNYRYPAGREAGAGPLISPKEYGNLLVSLYDRWIKDAPDFTVTPLDQMLRTVLESEHSRCPWTNSCTGRLLGIEPNGDTYNCSDFADLGDSAYRFGNIGQDSIGVMRQSTAARQLARRQVNMPSECLRCRHFAECRGGCMRDSVLYGGELGDKTFYCESWMMVFDRIKESLKTGEADAIVGRYGGGQP